MNRVACILLASAFVFALASPAQAQLDPGNVDVFQGGSKVGEIFVPARAPSAHRYIEHWVLFSGYVYPGSDSATTTEIRAATARYASAQNFFNRVPWGPGFRYVLIQATEAGRLPGH